MNKKELSRKNIIRNFAVIGLVLIILISLIFLVSALTDDERADFQSELDSLTAELSSQGYDWLVNYSIIYPFVEVYRENGNDVIAKFENVSSEGWYKIYLTNLSENESRDVFDLKLRKYEKISYGIIQKKMRIDEIRKRLNQGGRNI